MTRIKTLLPWLAALVVAAAPAYLLRYSFFGIPTTVLEILMYAFVALVIFSQWRKFRPVPRWVAWPVVLFLLAAAISTAITPDTRVALGILKAWIADPTLFAWALWQIPEREKLTAALTTGLLAGGLFVALVAVGQKLLGSVTVDGRVIGPYAWSPVENPSPNYLALYLAPLAVLAFGLAMRHVPRAKSRDIAMDYGSFIFPSVSFILMVLAILFSLSRGGLAAVGVGILAMLILRSWPWIRQQRLAKLSLLLLTALMLTTSWYYARPNLSLSPEVGGRITASNNVRWEIWRTTVREVIAKKPIVGVGLGNYQNYFTELTRGRINYDRIAPLALTPHNFLLAMWVNLGLLGLIAMAWFLIEVIRRVWGNVRVWKVTALLGSFVALLAHGLLDTPYFKNDLSLVFWTLVVLLVLFAEGTKMDSTDSPSKEARV